jgi:hypothetical protein
MTLRLIHQLRRIPRHMIWMGNTVESSRGARLEFLLCMWAGVKGLLQLLPSSGWQFIWMLKYRGGQPPTDHKSELRAVCKLMSLGPFIHSCKQCIVACCEVFGWRKMCLLCRMVWGNLVVTTVEGEECIVLVLTQCENFKVTLFEGPNQWEMWKFCNLWDVASDTLYSCGICLWRSRLFCSQECQLPSLFQRLDVGLLWSA